MNLNEFYISTVRFMIVTAIKCKTSMPKINWREDNSKAYDQQKIHV